MSRVAERALRRWRLMLLASGTPIRITLITQHHWRKQFKVPVHTVQGAGQTSVSHSHIYTHTHTLSPPLLHTLHQGRLEASSLFHPLLLLPSIDFIRSKELNWSAVLFCLLSEAGIYWRICLKQCAERQSGMRLMEYWYKCKVILKKPTNALWLFVKD